jgi:2-oxoacid:acceptor oxidoreductase gamma subunit (pyruvate/2-ketoisovalerate family)
MLEVRFHGRGGQGAVIASELLAQAAFLEGRQPQSFPFFGVERRGAPVTAYTRIDDAPIRVRTAVTNPDIVVVMDPGLLRAVNVTAGLKPEGLLLVNAEAFPTLPTGNAPARVAVVDATGIALAHGLGTRSVPIVNTAILGGLVRAGRVVSLDSLLEAIRTFVPACPEENAAAAREAYERVNTARAVVA